MSYRGPKVGNRSIPLIYTLRIEAFDVNGNHLGHTLPSFHLSCFRDHLMISYSVLAFPEAMSTDHNHYEIVYAWFYQSLGEPQGRRDVNWTFDLSTSCLFNWLFNALMDISHSHFVLDFQLTQFTYYPLFITIRVMNELKKGYLVFNFQREHTSFRQCSLSYWAYDVFGVQYWFDVLLTCFFQPR